MSKQMSVAQSAAEQLSHCGLQVDISFLHDAWACLEELKIRGNSCSALWHVWNLKCEGHRSIYKDWGDTENKNASTWDSRFLTETVLNRLLQFRD